MYGAVALLWLTLGTVVIVWGWLHPEQQTWHILGTNLSIGWLALLLGLYNAVRWWSRRSYEQNLRTQEAARAERERRHRTDPSSSREPAPELDFTRPPSNPE